MGQLKWGLSWQRCSQLLHSVLSGMTQILIIHNLWLVRVLTHIYIYGMLKINLIRVLNPEFLNLCTVLMFNHLKKLQNSTVASNIPKMFSMLHCVEKFFKPTTHVQSNTSIYECGKKRDLMWPNTAGLNLGALVYFRLESRRSIPRLLHKASCVIAWEKILSDISTHS